MIILIINNIVPINAIDNPNASIPLGTSIANNENDELSRGIADITPAITKEMAVTTKANIKTKNVNANAKTTISNGKAIGKAHIPARIYHTLLMPEDGLTAFCGFLLFSLIVELALI